MRASSVALGLLAVVMLSVAVEAHMTEFCFSTVSSTTVGVQRIKVLVEHWHSSTQAISAAASFRIRYPANTGAIWDATFPYTEVYLPGCTNGCPNQCTTSFDCNNENNPGHWAHDIDIPSNVPAQASVSIIMQNGGVITENQGACGEFGSTSWPIGFLQLPPPGCIGDICGDGIVATPAETCDIGPPVQLPQSCIDLGFAGGGTVTCGPCCDVVTSQCIVCGNVASCRSHTEVLNGSGSGSISFAEVDDGNSIVCSGFSANVSPSSVSCANAGNTISVTLTIGAESCTSAVTVQDNTNPVLTCPAAATVNTNAGQCSSTASTGTATITDNCPGSSVSVNPTPAYSLGTTTVTWSGVDDNGNSATSCTQQITVVDNENPVVTCPPQITINTDLGFCSSSVNIGSATATDNCAITGISELPTSPYPVGSTTVMWTAEDSSGNTDSCFQTVIVEDNENPSITCPLDISIATDNGVCTSSANIGTPSFSDNCPSAITTNIVPGPYNQGDTTVFWTATDASGNTASCSHVVNVFDNQNPVITVPSDQTININQGPTVDLSHPTVTCSDNCGCTVSHVSGPMQGDPLTPGQYTVTWSAEDTDGNIVFGSWTVSITGFSITGPTNGAAVYMYLSTEIDFTSYPPGDTDIMFELVDDVTLAQNYMEVIPATTNIVVVHEAVPGYWRVRMTGIPSGISSLGPLVRLCVGGWEGGECLFY